MAWFKARPKWYGDRTKAAPPVSQSYYETTYRRLKKYFNWLVERGHIENNPFNSIPHPKIDERVIPTVSEREIISLLSVTDPRKYSSRQAQFTALRDQTVFWVLVDTPSRRAEITGLTVDEVDLDIGSILVAGKGGRERWMPLGDVAQEALWSYMQVRATKAVQTDALWVDSMGRAMHPDWIRKMMIRRGTQAGIPNLHPHRFRHTFAVTALRNGTPERVLALHGGWKKIPDTYLRTLDDEDVKRFHRAVSPADRLAKGQIAQRREQRGGGKARGKL